MPVPMPMPECGPSGGASRGEAHFATGATDLYNGLIGGIYATHDLCPVGRH